MYCPSCGKQIPDQSRFCFECGAAVPTQTSQPAAAPKVTEWEYCYYVHWWDLGRGGSYQLDGNQTEMRARLEWWASHQKTFNPRLQEYLDQGWEPITEMGPNAYNLRHHKKGINEWLEVRDFRVKLRRPKSRDKPPHLVALLGRWESVEVIKRGLLANIMVGIGSTLGMYAKGYVYEFFDDYSFTGSSKGVNKNNWGIFDFFDKNQKFATITDKPAIVDEAHVIVSEITGPNEFILKTPDKGVEIVYRKI